MLIAAQQAAASTSAQKADSDEARVDAAMHASDLVAEVAQASMRAEQARKRSAAKKQRQKQRKQVLRMLDDPRLGSDTPLMIYSLVVSSAASGIKQGIV